MTDPRPYGVDVVDATIGDEVKSYPPTLEVGRSGLKRVSGYVQEEFLPQLRGRKAVRIYREMSENSTTIGGFLFAVERLIRNLDWVVEPASSRAEDRRNGELVEQNMHDMEHSWQDMIGEIMTMPTYGWAFHELVYKRRLGPWEKDPKRRSKYTDGLIGWRKIPGRSQHSLLRWVFDDVGDILAMVQMPAPHYRKIVLPMSKGLLFRTTTRWSNPEGYSLLRTAYVSWWYLKRLQEIEAVGIERDLTGMPIAYVPPHYLNPAPNSKESQMLAAIKQAVTAVRRNEQEGLIWPMEWGPNGEQLFDFKLMTSGGTRQFNVDAVIQRYKTEMLSGVLADFMMVGHENNGGSYALHTDKTGMFRTALNSFAQSIADVFNRHAIPKLFAINGMKPAELPRIVPGNVDPPDLAQLAQFVTAMAGAGMNFFPDPKMENFVRSAARLPKLDKETEDAREVEQRQSNILDLVQQKLQLLQAEQQAQAGAMSAQQQALGVQQQAMGLAQQQQAAQAAQAPQGDDPDQAKRSQVADATAKVKLAQEQERLKQMRTGPQGRNGKGQR